MIPHFVIMLTPSPRMLFELRFLLRSLRVHAGKIEVTLIIEESDPAPSVGADIEIVRYRQSTQYKFPWGECPRWNFTPRSDVCVLIDTDVIALADVTPIIDACRKTKQMYGLIARIHPFYEGKSYQRWKELYRTFDMDLPKMMYVYIEMGSDGKGLPINEDMYNVTSPFYVNHGIIVTPGEYIEPIRNQMKLTMPKLNGIMGDNFCLPQVATTLVVDQLNLPTAAMPKTWHHLDSFGVQPPEHTIFYHYTDSKRNCPNYIHGERDSIDDPQVRIQHFKNEFLEAQFRQLFSLV